MAIPGLNTHSLQEKTFCCWEGVLSATYDGSHRKPAVIALVSVPRDGDNTVKGEWLTSHTEPLTGD